MTFGDGRAWREACLSSWTTRPQLLFPRPELLAPMSAPQPSASHAGPVLAPAGTLPAARSQALLPGWPPAVPPPDSRVWTLLPDLCSFSTWEG